MQCSHSLTFDRIYQLEKTVYRSDAPQDAESSPLIRTNTDVDQIFRKALDVEMEKITSFYRLKELEIYGELSELVQDQEEYDAEDDDVDPMSGSGIRPRSNSISNAGLRRLSTMKSFQRARRTSTLSKSMEEDGIEDSDDEDDDERTALNKRPDTAKRTKSVSAIGGQGQNSARVPDMSASADMSKSARRNSQSYDDYSEQAFSALLSSSITLKKRTISLYVQLCELKSFIQLNRTGFKKVLKKYDKILDRKLKDTYLDTVVDAASTFQPDTIKHLDTNIEKVEDIYSDVVTGGDKALARKELRLHLREHVVWERNTVWREMIGIERKAQAANMGLRRTLLGVDTDPAAARLQGDDDDTGAMKELNTPLGRVTCPKWLFSSTFFTLVGIIAIFFALLFAPIMEKVEQQNCLAMLIFVSLLWATEVSKNPINSRYIVLIYHRSSHFLSPQS